jgi:lysyl-tRNA synthetase class 2
MTKPSSNIQKFTYEENFNELWVYFNNRTVYKYLDVPKDVYERFLKAESLGKFLNSDIKPNYKYEKII